MLEMLKMTETGGGYVRRRFSVGGKLMLAGDRLTAEDIASMSNRRLLVARGFIEIHEKHRNPTRPPRARRAA